MKVVILKPLASDEIYTHRPQRSNQHCSPYFYRVEFNPAHRIFSAIPRFTLSSLSVESGDGKAVSSP